MTGRNYDIQTSYLESLISLGLYNELLMVYETGFYNDLPHLYKMPNKLVLESLLTISTLFDHCNIKEIESQIYNNVKNLYSPISVRAIHILNGFYQTVIGNNGVEIDQDYGSIHYGELYTGSVLPEDKEKLKIRLIELVSFIGQKKPDERHCNRILQNEPLSVLARTNAWKVFQWAISCSKNELGESLEDVVKYQCWKGWSRVLNFVLDIINLDLTDRIHKDQPLSDSIAAQWISQLRTRFFTGPIIHSIFIDKYDRLPEHLRKSFAKPDVAPIYANELNVLTDSIILDTFENSDLVCFQRKTILLVYKYMVADDQHTADLIKTIVLYLKVFSLTELNAFFFNTTKGGAFQTNSSNDTKLLNRMLLRVAIAMLDELSDSHTLSELFEFEGKQSNPQAELGKLNQLLMKEENLVLLLELEPSLLWITNSSVPEFTTQHIEKNADILVDYLELAVKQQGSYYDKLMKVNTLVYFILQLWLINRLEELSNAEKITILTAVQTAETYKMRNMKLIIRQNLESKNVSSTQSVKMLVDSVVQLNKIDVISRNIASMFGMSGNE